MVIESLTTPPSVLPGKSQADVATHRLLKGRVLQLLGRKICTKHPFYRLHIVREFFKDSTDQGALVKATLYQMKTSCIGNSNEWFPLPSYGRRLGFAPIVCGVRTTHSVRLHQKPHNLIHPTGAGSPLELVWTAPRVPANPCVSHRVWWCS